MDPHAAWLRRVVLRRLGRKAGAHLVLVALGALLVFRSFGAPWLVGGPCAILFGQAVVLLSVGSRLVSGPLNLRYLQTYTERSLTFEAEALVCSTDVGLQRVLADHELTPIMSLSNPRIEDIDQRPIYEVFGSGDRMTFLTRASGGGATLVLSALTDGRYLVTTDLLLVPNRLLVVNLQPGRKVDRLVDSHARALAAFAEQGLHPTAASLAMVAAVLRCEQESFAALGPLLGSFLSLDGSTAPWRLAADVAPADLRRLAGRTQGPHRAGAVGALQPVASAHHA